MLRKDTSFRIALYILFLLSGACGLVSKGAMSYNLDYRQFRGED